MDKSVIQYCNTCKELAGFYCNGCNRMFCAHHTDQHRQLLNEQLDWITVDHDDLVNTLNNPSSISQRNLQSKKIIDKWEEDSIKYIRKTANEARRALIDAIKTHIKDVKEKLKVLTEKLNEACQKNNTFDERSIQQWSTTLNNIKQDFITMSTFTVRVHGNKPVVMPIIKAQPDLPDKPQQNSFGLVPIQNSISPYESSRNSVEHKKSVPRTSIDLNSTLLLPNDDRFHLSSDHVEIVDNGQVIIHDSTNSDASIRGFREYSQGEHKLIFRIEHITSDQWIFFGIIHKHASLEQRAYMDPSAHGWAGYNGIYINGKYIPGLSGYLDDMKMNDFIELTLDCNKQILFLWHSRQTYKNKLPIDLRICPFPWQFLISFYNPNDSVRILSSSMGSIIKQEQDKLDNDMEIKEIGMNKSN